jgi:hypothetical protein
MRVSDGLPAFPWAARPDDLPLTVEEVCAALAETNGLITKASLRLKVGSLVLRKFVDRSARAKAVIVEMSTRRAERAAERLDEALEADDARRNDWAIRWILNSAAARHLGLSSSDSSPDRPLVNITLAPNQWLDGTQIGPPAPPAPPIIEIAGPPEPKRASGE